MKKEFLENDKLLTCSELQELLNVSRTTIHRYVKGGILNAYKVGKRLYFLKSEVFENILSSEVKTEAA